MKLLLLILNRLFLKHRSQKYLTLNFKKEIEYETELDYNNHVASKINIYK